MRISQIRDEHIKEVFKNVYKVMDELLEISSEYASLDEWDKADIVSKAKNVLLEGFETELYAEEGINHG